MRHATLTLQIELIVPPEVPEEQLLHHLKARLGYVSPRGTVDQLLAYDRLLSGAKATTTYEVSLQEETNG